MSDHPMDHAMDEHYEKIGELIEHRQDKKATRRIDQSYIGDGVTAVYDGNGIMLKTPRESGEHYIYLEPEVVHSLMEFVAAIRERNDS